MDRRWSPTFAARAAAVRLRPGRHADLRARRGVPAGRASPPTSCARRCTTSTTRAAAASRCGPRAPRRSCARSCSTDPPVPWKVWYVAPHFRYERPQKGRYRQHWQLGAEVLGVDDPDVDVEVIALAARLLPRPRAHAGARCCSTRWATREPRPRTSPRCATYLLDHGAALGDEFRERVEQNPLRVLDAKRDDWQDVIERAPQLTEYLSDDVARRTSSAVQRRPRRARHRVRARARGSCAASTTTPAPRSSSQSDALDAAQNAVGGGGRYDKLAEEMGGPPTPGIGFGIGIERVLIACDAEGVAPGDRARGRRVRGRRARRDADARSRCSSPSSARTGCAPTARTAAGR